MAEPVLFPLPQGPGGEKLLSFYHIPPTVVILKLLKLKIDLTTRALPQLIRVPFLAEMLGAILFFVWFH